MPLFRLLPQRQRRLRGQWRHLLLSLLLRQWHRLPLDARSTTVLHTTPGTAQVLLSQPLLRRRRQLGQRHLRQRGGRSTTVPAMTLGTVRVLLSHLLPQRQRRLRGQRRPRRRRLRQRGGRSTTEPAMTPDTVPHPQRHRQLLPFRLMHGRWLRRRLRLFLPHLLRLLLCAQRSTTVPRATIPRGVALPSGVRLTR